MFSVLLRILAFHTAHILTAAVYLNLICNITIDNSNWDTVDGIETCQPTNLTVNNAEEFVVSLNGNKTKMESVHGFWVEDAKCEFIPRKIDAVLPNVRRIGFKNTDLKSLSKFDLAPFVELETLILMENRIKFLDGDLFEYNTKIKSLTLNESRLLIVNGAVLMPLNGLSVIEFELKAIQLTCEGKCGDKRCMKQTIDGFGQNCEFDSIFPGFKEKANGMKKISRNCEKGNATKEISNE